MPTLPLDAPSTNSESAHDGVASDQPAAPTSTSPSGVVRFRAATFDEAVALAVAEYGDQAEVVEANRIRRGGIGGFFATELGVEIAVRPPAPPASAASAGTALTGGIDRLLAQAEAAERAAAPGGFADVLARELGDARAEPVAPARATTEASDGLDRSIADWSHEAFRRLAIPEPAPTPEPQAPEAPDSEPSSTTPAPPRRRATAKPTAATATGTKSSARKTTGAKTTGAKTTGAKTTGTTPARRSSRAAAAGAPDTATVELVAHATTQLLGQLAAAPAPDTGAASVTIKVATPAGATIEMTAQLTPPAG